MAILRLSTGKVYAEYVDINELVKPLQVGRFLLPDDVREKVAQLEMPLTRQGADYLFQSLDTDAEKLMERHEFKFRYRRVGCYMPPEKRGGDCSFAIAEDGGGDVFVEEMTEGQLSEYLTPHNVLAHDWHFTFSGTIVKGVQLKSGLQAVVYVTAGEWIRLAPTVLNWPIFAFGRPVIGLSYFDREPENHGDFDMKLYPGHQIAASMQF